VTAITPDHDSRRRGRRKIAALLAGGLVAGVGTMATLASWNDSEFASGTFTAGHFDLEGSTDGGRTYSQHPTAEEAGVLNFELPVTNLSPGSWINGELKVRLAQGTTNNAQFRLQGAGTSGHLKGVAVYTWRDFEGTCADKPYDLDNAMAFSLDGATYRSGLIPLTKGASAEVAGEPVTICFAVLGGSGMPQGQTGAYAWKVSAVSVAD
jgi:predicted ribosomally synthesized peptide with SipW-like signal peptide